MLRSACGTDKGKLRGTNEDSMLCMDSLGFYMVADGVGGHNSGEIASRLAVDLMKTHLLANPPDRIKESDLPDFFNRCLWQINEEIYKRASSDVGNIGMATTAVMLLLRGKKHIFSMWRQPGLPIPAGSAYSHHRRSYICERAVKEWSHQ